MKGTIKIEIEGISFEETERYREVIHYLILSGGLNIKNGNTTLFFDDIGVLQEVETKAKRWRRNKVVRDPVRVVTTRIPENIA